MKRVFGPDKAVHNARVRQNRFDVVYDILQLTRQHTYEQNVYSAGDRSIVKVTFDSFLFEGRLTEKI